MAFTRYLNVSWHIITTVTSNLPKRNDTPSLHFIFKQFIKYDGVKYVIKMSELNVCFLIFIFWQGLLVSISENKYQKPSLFRLNYFQLFFFGVFPTAFLLTQKLFIVHSLILNTMNIYWMINENVINFISYISLLICPIKIRFQKFKYNTFTQCNRTVENLAKDFSLAG